MLDLEPDESKPAAAVTGEHSVEPARQRLLVCARDAFARHGFDGASVRDITTAAEANIGAINYYFGSKRLLYIAVMRALVGPLAPRIRFASITKRPPLDRVLDIVGAIFEHIRLNPDMPAIMTRELASGREIAAPIRQVFGDALPILVGVIAEGQRDGTIRPGDPILLAFSTIAQPVYFNLARPIITAVANVDPLEERVLEHVLSVVRAALEARP